MNSTAKQIARQRVQTLFQQATCTYKTNPKLAQRYINTATKIAMAARIRLPTAYKRQICRNCNTLLTPGYTSRIRLKPRREAHLTITCLNCGHQTRLPTKPKRRKNQHEQNNNKNEAPRKT